jgi:cob(I)alamin adenosyltransferase
MTGERGYIHIYTGNGKGKTTAAIGQGIRAIGNGLSVYMIQFMKGRRYSEIDALEKIPGFTVKQFGRDDFVNKTKPEQIDIDLACQGLQYAKKIIEEGKHDLVILDEINVAIDFHLIPLQDVLTLLDHKPPAMHLILTGRYAPPALIQKADLASEILEIKHPYQQGEHSRKGIDW